MNEISKGRIFAGVLLIFVSLLEFGWLSYVDESFAHGDVQFLRKTLMSLGVFFGVTGLFLAAGGSVASAVYAFLGLADIPLTRKNSTQPGVAFSRPLRVFTTILSGVGLWHLSVGWIFFPASTGPTDPMYQLAFCLVAFGAFPFVISPFCARRKQWALWATFAFWFCLLVCVLVLAEAGIVKPTPPPGYALQKNEAGIMYLGFMAILGLIAGLFAVVRPKKAKANSVEGTP